MRRETFFGEGDTQGRHLDSCFKVRTDKKEDPVFFGGSLSHTNELTVFTEGRTEQNTEGVFQSVFCPECDCREATQRDSWHPSIPPSVVLPYWF